MPEKNRTVLDAATEITIAAISTGKITLKDPKPDLPKYVTEFFSAVYKQIEQDTQNPNTSK